LALPAATTLSPVARRSTIRATTATTIPSTTTPPTPPLRFALRLLASTGSTRRALDAFDRVLRVGVERLFFFIAFDVDLEQIAIIAKL
jgi:hypothetical protein